MSRPTNNQQMQKMQEKINAISDRAFDVAVYESGEISVLRLSIGNIAFPMDNDMEVVYALNDRLDAVLDIKMGEAMYFRPVRDNKTTKGIIARVA